MQNRPATAAVALTVAAAAIAAASKNTKIVAPLRSHAPSRRDMSSHTTTYLDKTSVSSGRRVIDRLKGTGLVTTGRGKEISVKYHLSLAQDAVDSGAVEQAQLGPKRFSGQIWCPHDGSFVAVHLGQPMTLRMEDGRQLRFTHSNRDGGITVEKS